MKTIIPLIKERQDRYGGHPFIRFLQDSSVPPEVRLSYAPFAAFFIMSFSEFNRYHITLRAPKNEAERAINEHARDDGGHYEWFLEDLGTLGLNPECRLTDALRFLWSEEGQKARDLSHFLIGSTQNADSEMKVVILEAIEAMGAVWVRATVKSVQDHPKRAELNYFNETHEGRETDFMEQGGHRAIAAVQLSETTRTKAPSIVHGLFDRMEAFNDELLSRVGGARPVTTFSVGMVDH